MNNLAVYTLTGLGAGLALAAIFAPITVGAFFLGYWVRGEFDKYRGEEEG